MTAYRPHQRELALTGRGRRGWRPSKALFLEAERRLLIAMQDIERLQQLVADLREENRRLAR